ncbi:MAG TPA: hypothetical protein DIU39_04095, partial [Flavobacteriales bacterium]|nr:hypothetical protein [Flavobacteriales bacterium]
MKKLLYLFIAGALFACSSSTQLSNFSKQKYTKKFHHKTKKYNDGSFPDDELEELIKIFGIDLR